MQARVVTDPQKRLDTHAALFSSLARAENAEGVRVVDVELSEDDNARNAISNAHVCEVEHLKFPEVVNGCGGQENSNPSSNLTLSRHWEELNSSRL